MEFLPGAIKEVITKLNKNAKEEVDIIESIIIINNTNKEEIIYLC